MLHTGTWILITLFKALFLVYKYFQMQTSQLGYLFDSVGEYEFMTDVARCIHWLLKYCKIL